MPIDLEHPVFSPPPRDAILWRYLTLTKALGVFLTKTIYFPSLLELRADDPLEGRSTNLTRRVLKLAAANPEVARSLFGAGSDNDASDLMSLAKVVFDQLDVASKIHLVSCWHESDHESAALWKLYSLQGEGVAFRTTFGRLCDAIQSDLSIHAGRVSYEDYLTTMTTQGNTFYSVMTKRHSFEHEKEVRFVIADFRRLEQGVDVTKGLSVAADPREYVEEVVLSPYMAPWAVEAMRGALEAVGCKSPINRSPLMEID